MSGRIKMLVAKGAEEPEIRAAAIEEGMEVSVATRISDKGPLLESYGIKIIPVEIARSGTNPIQELITVLRLSRILRREKPDVLHLVAMKPVILGGVAAVLSGIENTVSAVAGMGFLFTGEKRMGFLRRIVMSLLIYLARHSRIIVQNPDDAAFLIESWIYR